MVVELKEIVRKIEDSETSLDEMISLYEQGTRLVKQCEERLSEAELKISTLGKDEK